MRTEKFSSYICSQCGEVWPTARQAKACESKCKALKLFKDKMRPVFEPGDLVLYHGRVYGVMRIDVQEDSRSTPRNYKFQLRYVVRRGDEFDEDGAPLYFHPACDELTLVARAAKVHRVCKKLEALVKKELGIELYDLMEAT